MALGFEPTTFIMWVSSHNHSTRAPAQAIESLYEIERVRIKLVGMENKLSCCKKRKDSELFASGETTAGAASPSNKKLGC